MTRQARGVLVGLGLGVVVLQSYVRIISTDVWVVKGVISGDSVSPSGFTGIGI